MVLSITKRIYGESSTESVYIQKTSICYENFDQSVYGIETDRTTNKNFCAGKQGSLNRSAIYFEFN